MVSVYFRKLLQARLFLKISEINVLRVNQIINIILCQNPVISKNMYTSTINRLLISEFLVGAFGTKLISYNLAS